MLFNVELFQGYIDLIIKGFQGSFYPISVTAAFSLHSDLCSDFISLHIWLILILITRHPVLSNSVLWWLKVFATPEVSPFSSATGSFSLDSIFKTVFTTRFYISDLLDYKNWILTFKGYRPSDSILSNVIFILLLSHRDKDLCLCQCVFVCSDVKFLFCFV